MIKYAVIILLAVVALVLTYASKKIAKAVFKTEEPHENDVFKIKMIALVIGIVDFVVALTIL